MDIEEKANQLGVDLSQVNLDSIILPLGEDFGIPSDDEEELRIREEVLEVEAEEGYRNVIVIDNIPRVPQEKVHKLKYLIQRIFGHFGTIKEGGLWIPLNESKNLTVGHCFVEFDTPRQAERAKEKMNGFKVATNCIFAVNSLEDFDRYMNVPDDWDIPETKPYTAAENLQQWLSDDKARDQFVIRADSDIEVLWNNIRPLKPELMCHHSHWTESFVRWSPFGSYLARIHKRGVVLCGGASTFNNLMCYVHPQVELVDFSPREKFLVTFNNQDGAHTAVLNIFDVKTRKVMRRFDGDANEFIGGFSKVSWPIFRWGGGKEDDYVAKLGKNVIDVYETKTFALLDKQSLNVENVEKFSWSPTDPIIAVFVPELGGGYQPARVTLLQIPGKEEMRRKSLISVSECRMYWQSNGEYLAVEVVRHTKTRKTVFELFRIKERNIPIEVLEVENTNDKIIAFAWEPKGQKFAVIHGDSTSFYTMRTSHNTSCVSKLGTFKGKQANALFWSPAGRFILLAGINGELEFFDAEELETLRTGVHLRATVIEWDPSGRYVATCVTSVNERDSGFHIWGFEGTLLHSSQRDLLHQFLWRPRPPSYLSAEKEEEIAKNLDKRNRK